MQVQKLKYLEGILTDNGNVTWKSEGALEFMLSKS